MPTAVAYLRRSTSRQALSIKRQRQAIEEWAAREGVHVATWYTEAAMSGSAPIDKRPALCDAMNAVEEHRAAFLVVDERSRLARDVYMAGAIGYELRRMGAEIASADGVGNGDSEASLIQRTLEDLLAMLERHRIQRRTRRAMAVKKRAGLKIGADAPYGWRYEGNRCVEDEREQEIRARILERYESLGSYGAVAAELNAADVPTRGAARWYSNTIRRICSYDPA